MVLDTIFNTLALYLFESQVVLGILIILSIVVAGISARIDRSGLMLLISPLVLEMGRRGFLPSVLSVVVFISIFILWGIMFKLIIGKSN